MPTGGDGTAYYGEETMTPTQKRKDTMLKKKYDDSDMKKNMQKQYGKEEGKKVYFATIRKQAMESTSPEEFYEALGIGALLKGALASAGGKAFLGGLGRGAMMSLPYIIAPKTMVTVAGLGAASQGAGLLKQTVRKSAAEKENENLRLKMQMGEELDKKDKPFVKHLVKKLRSGSKTHAKQADNLEKAMNEQLGGVGPKVAPSSQEMKKKLTVTKEPLTKQSLDARKTAQANVVGKMNQLGGITKTTSQNGKLDSMSIQGVGSGTNKDALKLALSKSGTGIKMDADGVVPNVGAVVQQKAEKGMNIARNTMSNNPTKFTSAQKNDFKTADNYLKSGQIEKNVQRQIPGSQQFRLDIGADEINLATQKFKPKTNKGFKLGMQKEDITDEALTIQDWNVDDIKFTEIETIDIIKAKPLKESMSNWRDELDEDWQKVNRKDKTDGMSQKAVNAYRKENPGSKLKTAVTKDPKKLKKGSKSAKRRLAFCRRMKGMKKKLTSAKTRRDPDSRINKALRRWNC